MARAASYHRPESARLPGGGRKALHTSPPTWLAFLGNKEPRSCLRTAQSVSFFPQATVAGQWCRAKSCQVGLAQPQCRIWPAGRRKASGLCLCKGDDLWSR